MHDLDEVGEDRMSERQVEAGIAESAAIAPEAQSSSCKNAEIFRDDFSLRTFFWQSKRKYGEGLLRDARKSLKAYLHYKADEYQRSLTQ